LRRIYIASSWKNAHQPEVVARLRAAGHQAYDFRHPTADWRGVHWHEIDPDYRDWTPAQQRTALDHPTAIEGFAHDWDAMRWADTGVLVLPAGRSAHIEAGYFAGADKELHILLQDTPEAELMYKMATAIHLTIDELVAALGE
jgi:hypothetical protein